MKFCTGTAKCFLTILSLVFFAVAVGIIVIGAWTYNEYGTYDSHLSSHLVVLPAVILIVVGIVVFLLGIVGCVGACKEQKCLLVVFFSFMLVIFVGLVSGSILAYVYRGKIDDSLEKGISDCMEKYGNDSSSCTRDIDYFQKEFKCCGSANYSDWLNEPWYTQHNKTMPYPESCCVHQTCQYVKNDTMLYTQGCHEKVVDGFKENLGIIAGVGAAFVVIQLVGMLFSCVLLCKKRSDVPYSELGDGMRV